MQPSSGAPLEPLVQQAELVLPGPLSLAVLLVRLVRQVRPGLLVQVEPAQLDRRVKSFSADRLVQLARLEDLAVQLARQETPVSLVQAEQVPRASLAKLARLARQGQPELPERLVA